jgi:hypothetical protein
VLLLGDTNSALAAIAAKRRKIPIFHMEAGNRCFDFRVPEEINRRIVDHIADINLTYSEIAREYLLREGLPPDQVLIYAAGDAAGARALYERMLVFYPAHPLAWAGLSVASEAARLPAEAARARRQAERLLEALEPTYGGR